MPGNSPRGADTSLRDGWAVGYSWHDYGTDRTIFWSTDGGLTWGGHSSGGEFCMGISAVSSQEAWGVVENVEGTIWRTADGGTTWEEQTTLGGENLPGLCTVSFVIPEPATLALLALGGLALIRKRN